MRLDLFFDQLLGVELSQHVWGLRDDLGLPEQPERLVSLINAGLLELHTKFLLRKGTFFISYDCSDRLIKLCSSNPKLRWENSPPNFIALLQLLDCSGREVRLNAIHRRQPCPSVVEVLMHSQMEWEINGPGGLLKGIYKRHGDLLPMPSEVSLWSPVDYEIDLPEHFLRALNLYVCARLFSSLPLMNTGNGSPSPHITYHQQYQQELNTLLGYEGELSSSGNYQQRFTETGMP